MKTYAEATPYERMFLPVPPNDDPWWCSTQSVASWVELYRACEYTEDVLHSRLNELIEGTYQPMWACEVPLRIAALQQLLGIAEAPAGWICPTCQARERRKQKASDTAQTSLF